MYERRIRVNHWQPEVVYPNLYYGFERLGAILLGRLLDLDPNED